jgi:tetratricopeptide (TPR) repeat protein
VAFVNTQVPGVEIQYRVGGDIATLKRLLAAGFPVMIEETLMGETSSWPNDDRWAAHYLLITGYDDANQTFTTQDSYISANLIAPYSTLYQNWQSFNRVYILIYPPESRSTIQAIVGDQWDAEVNRRHAMDVAQNETELNSKDTFAWFNLGTNLVYLDKYSQAATAYDKAREVGLPQRMLRYQFGPFFAYFYVNRLDDLLELTDYALKISPTSEEALLWRGWAMYRKGNKEEAIKLFKKGLEQHPGYSDAEYALKFVGEN